MAVERRYAAGEIRSKSDDGMSFAGLASRFNSQTLIGNPKKGGFYEEVAPGAFSRVLADGADVRALFNHDPNYLLGRTTSGTLRLEETDEGLADEIDLPDNTAGRDVAVSVRRGDLTGQSFTFMVEKDAWKAMPGGHAQKRTIISVGSLLDVSPVTYPAYDETTAAVRSADALIGLARREKRDGRDVPVGRYVAGAEAAVDAAEDALAGGNRAQAADCLVAACAAVDSALCAMWDVNTDLLAALGLPDLCGMLDAAYTAVRAAVSTVATDMPDPAVVAAAEDSLEEVMAVLNIPDPDDTGAAPADEGAGEDSYDDEDRAAAMRRLEIAKLRVHTLGFIVNTRG